MGPIWGPSGVDRIQVGPMLAHELCYLTGRSHSGAPVNAPHFPTPLLPPTLHDDAIKWKHFPRHWPFVRGIHRSPVNWANNREAGDFRHHRAHYNASVIDAKLSNDMLWRSRIIPQEPMPLLLKPWLSVARHQLPQYWWCQIDRPFSSSTLRLRHNECDGVSNHQPHDCLFKHLFRRR